MLSKDWSLRALWRIWPEGWALLVVIIIVFTVSGCTAGSKAALQTGIASIQDGADTAAQAMIASTCAMTVGAYKRLENALQKTGVDYLCPSRLDPPSAP